jgi:glycosyltransferase involved in cell wall biosynthesis
VLDTKPLLPKIAVVIPAYNQAEFLTEAVESVMRQSLPAAQVLVVNDGSTDATDEVMQTLLTRFPDIQYISQPNAGVCEACQVALMAVTQPLLVRLDADDWIPDNYLRVLFDCLQDQPDEVAFAYCDARLFGAVDGWIKAGRWSVTRLIPENYIHISSLVRTSIAREVGYYSSVMKGGYEDWDFYLTLAERGYRGVYCPNTSLWYRQKQTGGRNTMAREKDRGLRSKIVERHPAFYSKPYYRLVIFLWRLKRRVKYWLGVV